MLTLENASEDELRAAGDLHGSIRQAALDEQAGAGLPNDLVSKTANERVLTGEPTRLVPRSPWLRLLSDAGGELGIALGEAAPRGRGDGKCWCSGGQAAGSL
jgi:hypothetical protein